MVGVQGAQGVDLLGDVGGQLLSVRGDPGRVGTARVDPVAHALDDNRVQRLLANDGLALEGGQLGQVAPQAGQVRELERPQVKLQGEEGREGGWWASARSDGHSPFPPLTARSSPLFSTAPLTPPLPVHQLAVGKVRFWSLDGLGKPGPTGEGSGDDLVGSAGRR